MQSAWEASEQRNTRDNQGCEWRLWTVLKKLIARFNCNVLHPQPRGKVRPGVIKCVSDTILSPLYLVNGATRAKLFSLWLDTSCCHHESRQFIHSLFYPKAWQLSAWQKTTEAKEGSFVNAVSCKQNNLEQENKQHWPFASIKCSLSLSGRSFGLSCVSNENPHQVWLPCGSGDHSRPQIVPNAFVPNVPTGIHIWHQAFWAIIYWVSTSGKTLMPFPRDR